jgi:Zn-finger nucleic acid-binding protein
MKCPACQQPDLVMSERAGIEVDYCPQCRGVWLDRGELDKIIERSNQFDQRDDRSRQPVQDQTYRRSDSVDEDYDERRGGYRKKKSFWQEIFD